MKIGILAVSTGNLDLEVSRRDYPRMFVDFLDRTGAGFTYAFYDVLEKDELPIEADECDAYLITGSKHGAYEDLPWIHRLARFIRQADKARATLIGICFGHQMVAHALGGTVINAKEKGWGVGCRDMEIVREFPWMTPPKKNVPLLYSHQDQVVALPPGAVRLGRSDFCEQLAFVKDSHILCFQGHPEFTEQYLRDLMATRTAIIPKPVYEQALASFSTPAESALVGKWIASFIEQNRKS